MSTVRAPGSFVMVVAIALSACAQRNAGPVYGPPPAPYPAYAPAAPTMASLPAYQPQPSAFNAPVADPGRIIGTALTMWGWSPPGAPAPAAPAAPAWPAGIPSSIPWPSIPGLPGLGAPPANPAPGAPALPAAPSAPSSGRPGSWEQLEQEVFTETNARRARGAVCGSTTFPPAAPLALHPSLQAMAREHSVDMATRNYFEHATPEGQGPGPRGRAHGYHGVFTGENIAAGSRTAVEAVDQWMSSTGHCSNIMDGRYHFFGAGYAENGGSTYQRYWTQNFGP